MSWSDRVSQAIGALIGRTVYQSEPSKTGVSISAETVERLRHATGGQLQPMPQTVTRWYVRDLETARRAADAGDLSAMGQLYRAMRSDAVFAGLLSTRTDGLVRLPKKFRGDPEIVAALRGALEGEQGADEDEEQRGIFDQAFPPSELALLAADGVVCGVGVAELVEVEGRDFPAMVRLDPEFLRYRWSENRWYFASIGGLIPITPGDRFILHTPGGRSAPWQHALWQAMGRAYIRKDHADHNTSNWESKLANPARAAYAPAGASESQRDGFLQSLIAWGVNTVFELPIGWDVKLIESNGNGHESFQASMDRSDREYQIGIAGQVVTTDGGAGFSNADIHKTIRADLIKATADQLAHTINTQGIPQIVVIRWGEERLRKRVEVSWEIVAPKDRTAEATTLNVVGQALTVLGAALKPYGLKVDAAELCSSFGIPIRGDVDGDGRPDAGAEELSEVDAANEADADASAEGKLTASREGKLTAESDSEVEAA